MGVTRPWGPNRFFFLRNDLAYFKFGSYRSQLLADVVKERRGREYIRWMLAEVDDLPEDVRAYLEEALRLHDDPLLHNLTAPPSLPPPPPDQSSEEVEFASLRTKVNTWKKKRQEERRAKEMEEVVDKRKDEAVW